jgi:hypothetical protein
MMSFLTQEQIMPQVRFIGLDVHKKKIAVAEPKKAATVRF